MMDRSPNPASKISSGGTRESLATQDGRAGSLAFGEIGANLLGHPRKAWLTLQETRVALHQARKSVVRGDRAIIAVVDSHRAAAVRANA
jgi:hypothetical protein